MKIKLLLIALLTATVVNARDQIVYLLYEKSVPQAVYASELLKTALSEHGYSVTEKDTHYDFMINIDIHPQSLKEEAYSVMPEGNIITIIGGDERGIIYGALSLIEEIRNGNDFKNVRAKSESARLPFRGIKHNLPWDSYRPSSALDQHYDTVRDIQYWEAFLDMMVENRFNALTLWNLHPFTYMIMPENFPEASPFSEQELKEWQSLYRNIFSMAKTRGIDTYIVNWNIFVSRELAEAHNVAAENFYPHYFSEGDTSEIVRRYIRESVTQMLEEYPDLSGFGISHGEGMGGMTPQQRQDWMNETIIEGMRRANRTAKFIHRVPFSADLGSGGSTSIHTEQLTRKAMEDLGDFFDGPIWVEMKFNWSHAHSSPKLVKVHGGELGDTYFKPKPQNYKITWMARNEDFFALRWGVPDFIREHISLNAAESYVGGYFVGSETYIPALDYFTAIDEEVDWQYAFERQWLFYKLWGRLLYNPETSDTVFKNEFVRRYGLQAESLLDAYSLASSTPLRLASAFDLSWDFTLYSEGFMALDGMSMDYISVDRLINRPPLDPDYVSVKEYVETGLAGGYFDSHRITPAVLASMLESDCLTALKLVKNIDAGYNPSLMYEVSDVKTWANLGLHLAEKLKGAVALETYRRSGGEQNKHNAVIHLEKALAYWDRVIEITRPIYRDMPLTHYNAGSHERNDNNLFHWETIRHEVARDVETARNAHPAGEH